MELLYKPLVRLQNWKAVKNQADLKKNVGLRAPTYLHVAKTGPSPKNLLPFCESFFFSLILLINPSLKSLKAVFKLKKGYRDCYYMHSYLIYSICRPIKMMVRRGHKIMLNFKKKTYNYQNWNWWVGAQQPNKFLRMPPSKIESVTIFWKYNIFVERLKDSTQSKHNCVKTFDVRHDAKRYRVSQWITAHGKCNYSATFSFKWFKIVWWRAEWTFLTPCRIASLVYVCMHYLGFVARIPVFGVFG